MIDVVRNDSAPPLFYLVERLFAVVSTSPPMLRLFPVLAGSCGDPSRRGAGTPCRGRCRRHLGGCDRGRRSRAAGQLARRAHVRARDHAGARLDALPAARARAAVAAALGALPRGMSILAVYTVYFALFAVFAQVITVAVLHRRHGCGTVGARRSARRRDRCEPGPVDRRRQRTAQPQRGCVLGAEVEHHAASSAASSSSSPGPPLNTWVAGFAALRALELAGDVVGCLVLVALVVNRRRLTAAGADGRGIPWARGRRSASA